MQRMEDRSGGHILASLDALWRRALEPSGRRLVLPLRSNNRLKAPVNTETGVSQCETQHVGAEGAA
jgi:hypothetical protein